MTARQTELRDATRDDFSELLRLNLESEHFLSPLDGARLSDLHEQSTYHRVVADDNSVHAFLMVFAQGAGYDSPNYLWFDQRYQDYLYVDRVVVDLRYLSQRLGSRLYDDLFQYARESGYTSVACEYDVEPPNERSRRFHERYGFSEVGAQSAQGGKKQVSMQLAVLDKTN